MGVRFALPAPDVTVAEWLRRWIVAPTTRVQFSPVTPDQRRRSLVTLSGHKVDHAASLVVKGVRLVESRQSLKLASGVRFAHPYHWPLAQMAARRALNAEVPGSRPGRPARVSRGHRPKDRTVRYERTNRGSTPRARTKFRPVVQSHRTQRSER
jgi:hypothetical protein